MEKRVDSVVFRNLSKAEFDHINHAGSHYGNGGGQSYIDFPKRNIDINKWIDFLGPRTASRTGNRPEWDFVINSFGYSISHNLTIFHRRSASISISSQKYLGQGANRVPSWHPNNGFPVVYSPNIVVYIVKTTDDEFWAGWFDQKNVPSTWAKDELLANMFDSSAGYLKFQRKVFVETTNKIWPFHFNAENIVNDIPTEDDLSADLELQDTSPRLQELVNSNSQPEFVNRLMRIRQRNNKLVRNLKNLYHGRCQITGEQFTFLKKNGEFYSEVHHLIALGENGSDSYDNAIVVSPLIHRMLHYADISEINLNSIVDGKLPISINGVVYEITWHPDHRNTVQQVLND